MTQRNAWTTKPDLSKVIDNKEGILLNININTIL